ncbi:MAG: phage tail protein, partial [Deltaproteobacteria bacterium]|nr:phage tail protein [Deltaproteobacteria bacterium]
VTGIDVVFKDLRGGDILFLPQRIAVVGQGNSAAAYSTDKRQVTSAAEVATEYGPGSPLHLAVLQLLPINGDGVGTIPVTVFPLEDDGAGVASVGDITPINAATEAASYKVRVNNIDSEEFVVSPGDAVADIVTDITAKINAVLEMPVIAADNVTDVTITSKWEGVSANDIVVEVVGPSVGVTFGITQPVGGLVNPDIDAALAQIGDIWETLVLNCLDIADTDILDTYSAFGEGRWGELTKKPLIVFTGNTATTVAAAIVVSDARKIDRTNAQLVAPGSNDLPFVVASRQLARIAVVANNNPPQDYGSQSATGLTPGADGVQWNYAEQNLAVTSGSSTTKVKDGVIDIADVVTFYHPTGDPIPAYRYVVDIIKLMTIIFNTDLIFATPEWDGAPLIPDDQPTTNPTAKQPKSAVAAIASMVDSLGENAIISDSKEAKASIAAQINSQNPKRLDVDFTVRVSGNTNIKGVTLNWGFSFGTQPIVG